MAIVPDSITSDSNVIGACWRKVRCEHCGISYVFRVEAKIRTPEARRFDLNGPTELERISPDNERHVAYVLERRIEPVPCAVCWKYQTDMCNAIRRARVARMHTEAIVLLSVGGCGIFMMVSDGISTGSFGPAFWSIVLVSGLMMLAGAAMLMLRRRKMATHDPNARATEAARRQLAQSRAIVEAHFPLRKLGVRPVEWGRS